MQYLQARRKPSSRSWWVAWLTTRYRISVKISCLSTVFIVHVQAGIKGWRPVVTVQTPYPGAVWCWPKLGGFIVLNRMVSFLQQCWCAAAMDPAWGGEPYLHRSVYNHGQPHRTTGGIQLVFLVGWPCCREEIFDSFSVSTLPPRPLVVQISACHSLDSSGSTAAVGLQLIDSHALVHRWRCGWWSI